MKNILPPYRRTLLILLIFIASGKFLLAQPNQYEHRNYLGWVRDMSTTETPYEGWPSIRIDPNLTDDYDKTLDFMAARGLNEITLWGLFTAKSWEPVIENTIDADRKALINTWVNKAHSRGIKVLSGMGVFSWGFSKIMDANPSVRCSCNAEAMDPSNTDSWTWQNKVVDYIMNNFSFDGISMQSADLGRCNCGDYAKYGDIEYHSIINNKVAAYIKSKNTNYIVGISGWGMNFSNASDINFMKTMTTHVDYLIDVEETALRNSRTHRQNIVNAISPCKFGSIGSPNIEPIQVLERDRYFIPTYYRASSRLKDLFADGGRACETYFRERGNPGDAVTSDVLGAIESNVSADISTTAQSILSVFSPVDNSALTDLEKLFKDAEDAYFNNAPSNNVEIILLQARATTIPQLPDYLTNMSSDGKTNYDNALRTLYSTATNLLTRINNKDKMQLVIRCIGRAINDLVAIRGTGSNVSLPEGAWRETPHNVPGKIEAEDFDKGGEGVAYHVNSKSNLGKSYRADAVGVASDPGITVIGYTDDSGEWIKYTVNITAGTYDIYSNISSASGGGRLKITVDGQEQTVSIPSTGGWGTYQRIKVGSVSLGSGSNKILRLDILTGGYNIDYIDIVGSATTPPPTTTSYSINAGGGAAGTFASDAYVSGGNTYSGTSTIDASGVANAAPAAVYQSERWGPSTYTFPSLDAAKSYTVRLHFAEIYFNAAGKRKFNVDINGTRQLTDFDVFAAAGAANKALVKEFTITPNSGNNIVIAFTNGALDNAKISGIEIFPAVVTPPTSTNLVANPGFEADNAGTKTPQGWSVWSASGTDNGVSYTESSGGAGPANGGNYYAVHYSASAWKQVNTLQNITGLANGTYQLSAYVKSTAAIGNMYAGRFDASNNYITTAIPVTTTWTPISMNVGVTNGKCEIGFTSISTAGNQFIAFDDMSFTLTTTATGAREASANGKKSENTEPALNRFNVYPNPSSGIANISYTAMHNEQIAIHLYDTQGRLVKTIFTGTALKGVEQNYTIDGSSLREGLYIIKLKTSSETINKKVIFNR